MAPCPEGTSACNTVPPGHNSDDVAASPGMVGMVRRRGGLSQRGRGACPGAGCTTGVISGVGGTMWPHGDRLGARGTIATTWWHAPWDRWRTRPGARGMELDACRLLTRPLCYFWHYVRRRPILLITVPTVSFRQKKNSIYVLVVRESRNGLE